MINLTQVQTFLTVVDTEGFRAAARMLDLAPSTVLDHVQQLESDLGVALVVRRRGSVRPTPQGSTFMPLARAMLDTALQARRLLSGGALRVAAASNIGTYLLHQPLASFKRQEDVEVDLWVGSNPQIKDRLTSGMADIAIAETWEKTDGFDAHSWRREPLVLIVNPEHRLAGRRRVRISDLLEETLLGGERGTGTGALLRAELGDIHRQLKTADGYGNTEAVKRGVRAGLGVSLVMASAVSDEVKAGTLVALRIEGLKLVKQTRIVVPAGIPSTAAAHRFLNHALHLLP
jgi:DNA-binding transcriptional LysR family regulator